MKTRKQIIALCLMLLCHVGTKAQGSTHWQCDIYAYEYDMTVYYTLTYNDEAVADMANYEVAAFCGEECRGVGEVQTVTLTDNSTVNYGYLRIRSNQTSGEEISLMVYDKTLDVESHIIETFTFKSQDLAGMPSSPTELTFYDERPITVTVDNYSREYGDANPTFAFTVEGPELVGIPEVTCEATEESPVGDYPIVITKGSVKNVNVTYVNGTLTVTKAPLKISVGTYTKICGEENPEFHLSYEGFKNEETEDVLTSLPVVTTIANAESVPGEYVISIEGAESDRYEISYENGLLVIEDISQLQNALQERYEGIMSEVNHIEEAVSQLEETYHSLLESFNQMQNDLDNLGTRIEEIRQLLADASLGQNDKDALQEELRILEERYNSLCDNSEQLEKMLTYYSEQLTIMESLKEELLLQADKLKQVWENAMTIQDIDLIKGLLDKIEQMISENEDVLMTFETMYEDMMKQMDDVNSLIENISEMEKEIETMKEELLTLPVKLMSVENGNGYIYGINGVRKSRNIKSLAPLPHGIYIVNGRKYVK